MNIWLKKYYRYDVQKLLIGIDGIRFFETIGGKYVKLSLLSGEKTISVSGGADLQSNNKQHGVEVSETGVKVKGATDMPGVLASGRVGMTNQHQYQWGAKKSTSLVTYTATGQYDVPHNAGSTYMVSVQAQGDGIIAYLISQGNNTFRVQLRNSSGTPVTGYFNYTIVGSN